MARQPLQPQDKYVLRLPDGMRDRLKAAAEDNARTMNAEILWRIEFGEYGAAQLHDLMERNDLLRLERDKLYSQRNLALIRLREIDPESAEQIMGEDGASQDATLLRLVGQLTKALQEANERENRMEQLADTLAILTDMAVETMRVLRERLPEKPV